MFSYLGANLPIWRFAQPVNYIGFWITLVTILLSAVGMVVAPLLGTRDMGGNLIGTFALPALKGFGFGFEAGKAWQPLWPMLFVTIACGAISGWHSLVGSVGTARQLEYETDGLPVGAGAMFAENSLALLSLTAVSIAGVGGGGGRFAMGVGKLVYAGTFGLVPEIFGTALGFGTFVMIVLTVTQLVFRVMRVTLTEWVGDDIPAVRNMHVSSVISMLLTLALVLTGTWVYLWQMFGASNQLMAALGLLVVAVWLKSEKRNPTYALRADGLHVRDHLAATAITAWNLYATIAANPKMTGLPVAGAWAMITVSALLFVAAVLIGWDGYKAYVRHGATPAAPAPRPAAAPRRDLSCTGPCQGNARSARACTASKKSRAGFRRSGSTTWSWKFGPATRAPTTAAPPARRAGPTPGGRRRVPAPQRLHDARPRRRASPPVAPATPAARAEARRARTSSSDRALRIRPPGLAQRAADDERVAAATAAAECPYPGYIARFEEDHHRHAGERGFAIADHHLDRGGAQPAHGGALAERRQAALHPAHQCASLADVPDGPGGEPGHDRDRGDSDEFRHRGRER